MGEYDLVSVRADKADTVMRLHKRRGVELVADQNFTFKIRTCVSVQTDGDGVRCWNRYRNSVS